MACLCHALEMMQAVDSTGLQVTLLLLLLHQQPLLLLLLGNCLLQNELLQSIPRCKGSPTCIVFLVRSSC